MVLKGTRVVPALGEGVEAGGKNTHTPCSSSLKERRM